MPTTRAATAEPMPTPDVPDADVDAAHRALYRRWRSQRFADLLGQDAIVATLRHAVAADRLAHAYLFVGPRGTGKTSTARILAKAINCTARDAEGEPCDRCAACVAIREGRALDVIEIDAASHGLVEDARDLVMRALTAPSDLRRRVYIIDEVHMLSTHAFNALLKLIEEPPDHVIFILATTDTHKVPATVISRTQRFDFRRLSEEVIAGKLARICASEEADADPEALRLLARLADGGMRDAESLLDQVLAYAGDQLTVAAVREAVGLAEDETVGALIDAFLDGDAPTALERIAALADAGRDVAQVAAQAEAEARRRLLASAGEPAVAGRLASVLRTLAEAAGVGAREGRARLLMELLAVEQSLAARPAQERTPERTVAEEQRPAPAPAAQRPAPVAAPSAPVVASARQPATEQPASAPPAAAGTPTVEDLSRRWAEVVESATPVVKPLLRECRPVAIDGARLTLAFPEGRDFMRTRIAQRAGTIEALLADMFGRPFAIECVASNVEFPPLSVEQAVGGETNDPEARALLEGVLKITGGELVDAPEVR